VTEELKAVGTDDMCKWWLVSTISWVSLIPKGSVLKQVEEDN